MGGKAYPRGTFALMARCLAGESSDEDAVRLANLFSSHPLLKDEYRCLQHLFFDDHFKGSGTSFEEARQKALDRIRRKLKRIG
jgi:hypothetical protein